VTAEAVFTTAGRGNRSDRSRGTLHSRHGGISGACPVSAKNDAVATVKKLNGLRDESEGSHSNLRSP
jgi:hypothetical protein